MRLSSGWAQRLSWDGLSAMECEEPEPCSVRTLDDLRRVVEPSTGLRLAPAGEEDR